MCGIVKRRFVFEKQKAAIEKAAERERKLQEAATGKAEAERLNADLGARLAQLESILQRGLEREAAIDLNAMLRRDEFPPLDLGSYGVAPPRPAWSDYVPGEPGAMAGLFGGKARHDRQLAAARQAFERAERDYDQAEAARRGLGTTNRLHATRQLIWPTKMTSRATMAS